MTNDEAVHALVQRAYGEVGYHEGSNNFTKYAEDNRITRLFGWNVQNQPWCSTFVHWIFIDVFGYDNAIQMTYGGSAACRIDADMYKKNGAWSATPKKGSVIYFYSNGDINHEGIVVDISGATITTVEGNYSDRVSKNTYFVNDPSIAGYGVPNWDVVAGMPETSDETADETDLKRKYYHLEYGSGINSPLPQVKSWQNMLLCWGFDLGKAGADGEFGTLTMIATQKWQEKAKSIGLNVEVNGIVDEDDWKEIIQVPVD